MINGKKENIIVKELNWNERGDEWRKSNSKTAKENNKTIEIYVQYKWNYWNKEKKWND